MTKETTVPTGSEISKHLGQSYFHDAFEIPLAQSDLSAIELFTAMLAQTPAWIDRLMTIRNRVVALAGLKDLGALGAVDPSKPAAAYAVGDRVGIFSIRYLSEDEVILGDNDRHLDVKVSLCKRHIADQHTAVVSTVVHVHNFFGRLYMALVVPFHRRIVPAVLRGASFTARGN